MTSRERDQYMTSNNSYDQFWSDSQAEIDQTFNLGTFYSGEPEILLFYPFYEVLHEIENRRKSGHSTHRIPVCGVPRKISLGA